MKLLKKNMRSGELSFRIEVPDDFFYLADIISKGDVVYAMTKRRVEVHTRGDVHRSERIDRKPVRLGVKVDDVEFDENVDRLRVLGKIVDGPEEIPRGDFHTLNLKPGMRLSIIKEKWASTDFALIADASKTIKARVMLVAIEDGYCSIGTLRNYGVKNLGTITASMSGKDESEKHEPEEKKFFKEVLDAIKTSQVIPDRIIIAGPGFVKDSFFKFLKEKDSELASKSVVESISVAGEKGLQEIVNRGIIERVVKEWKVQEEVEALQKLFEEMKKDSGLVSYGLEAVRKSAEMGAVETLLISNKVLRKAKAEKNQEIEELLDLVNNSKSKIMIVSGEHDFGKQLEGIGGIASINRYKVQ